jgi:hypothetical protein
LILTKVAAGTRELRSRISWTACGSIPGV